MILRQQGALVLALLAALTAFISDQTVKNFSANQVINFAAAGSVSLPISMTILSVLSWLVILWLFYSRWQKRPTQKIEGVEIFLWGLLLGSGASNIYDRFLFGGVRDVWPMPLLDWQNNLADWLIFLSVISLMILFYRTYFLSILKRS